MSLPQVLIIGAMKAGTTSMYMDLAAHPSVLLAQDKEPHALCDDRVLTAAGRADYEAIYAAASSDALCCDASTGYAKRPDFEGVVQRANETLPAGYKVIYLIRHPIERIVSQHHHEHVKGLVGPSIDEEVRRHARYIQYSRYAYQLEPWLESLGNERVRVVCFEDYVSRRREMVGEMYRFLGLPSLKDSDDESRIYNKSQGKPVKNRFWEAVRRNSAYRRWLRPLTPPKLRLTLQQLILPKAEMKLPPPSNETVSFLRDSLRDDVVLLGQMLDQKLPWKEFDEPASASAETAEKA